jgi:BASS family bile acid:Na+ symporter
VKKLLFEIIKIGLPLSIMGTVFAQGLMLAPGQLLAFFKEHPLLMLRSLVVVLVLVPLAALAIILLLKPSPAIGIGLAILAASPMAPLQFMNIAKQGGSLVYLGVLHLSLALLAIISVPGVLYLLSQALGFQAEVDKFQVAKTVGRTIFLPILLGMVVRTFFPKAAGKIVPALGKVATITLYVLALPILVITSKLFLKMDLWSYFVIAIFIVANLAIGHMLGPRDAQGRTTLAMESAARNFGLAVMIGVLNFSREEALPVFILYMIVFVAISTIYLKWRKNATTHAGVAELVKVQ